MGEMTGIDSLVWLRRLVGLRFIGLVPLTGAALFAAERGALESPGELFALVLGAAFVNLALVVVARRGGPSVATACLFASLVVDVLLVLLAAPLLGDHGGFVAPFVVLPVLCGVMALPERTAAALALVALALVLLLPAAAPFSSFTAFALLLPIAAAVLWYRRRGRFLEDRVERLEAERRERPARVVVSAPPPEIRDAEAIPAEPATGLHRVAAELAAELAQPSGATRAGIERLRLALRDRADLRHLMPDLDRMLRASDRVDDARRTLAILSGADVGAAPSVDAAAVLREVRADLEAEFARDGLRIRVEAARRTPPVQASHNEVRLVLIRLLHAARLAAAASGKSSRVDARAQQEGNDVVLVVEDPFPAPPEADLEQAFDPSYGPRERPGLGLALAVARVVAQRHGGRVELQRPEGGGLVVRVRLLAVARRLRRSRGAEREASA